MKRIAFLMIALFMIGGVVMAQGQRGEHKKMTPAERAEKMTERMVKEYSLNDAQKKQLLEVNLARCEKMDARMSMRPDVNGKKDGKKAPPMTSLFLSYEASGMQSSVDYSWTPTEEEREKMRAEMKNANDEYNAQLQKIMTEEQYASYTKKQSEREQRMKEGRRERK